LIRRRQGNVIHLTYQAVHHHITVCWQSIKIHACCIKIRACCYTGGYTCAGYNLIQIDILNNEKGKWEILMNINFLSKKLYFWWRKFFSNKRLKNAKFFHHKQNTKIPKLFVDNIINTSFIYYFIHIHYGEEFNQTKVIYFAANHHSMSSSSSSSSSFSFLLPEHETVEIFFKFDFGRFFRAGGVIFKVEIR